MKLPLAYHPHPILRQKAERVNYIDDALRQLVNDMFETMHLSRGIGLAAPQIFRSITLFVSCVPILSDGKWFRGKNRIFINPQIISQSSEMQQSEEGCLSIPQIHVTIARPQSIHIQATDLTGSHFEETLTGLPAANFLHEYDHLQGILNIDYLSEQERKKIAPELERIESLLANKQI